MPVRQEDTKPIRSEKGFEWCTKASLNENKLATDVVKFLGTMNNPFSSSAFSGTKSSFLT